MNQENHSSLPTFSVQRTPTKEELKQEFLDCLAAGWKVRNTLREVVGNLLQTHVPRKVLIEWGVAAGYSLSYVRNILSNIFVGLRQRTRRPGAGRATPPAALSIMASVHDKHGLKLGNRYLLAAYRAGKAVETARRAQEGVA